jgi:beta-lactamase regulating signal transducer with metallopeptidase domain
LGWTLIHSLWQGAAAAIGLALLMIFMRRYSARTRYLAGVTVLVFIVAMSVVTFGSIYNPAAQAAVAGESSAGAVMTTAVNTGNGVSMTAFFKDYFNRHLPLVVTIWMMGILVLALRFAGGYIYNQRLKNHHHKPAAGDLQHRLETFCRRTGLQTPIRLVESALVKVPMTIGHFKPVILFPLGMATGMPADQVEALLAHELAHILRKDYLFNILQNFADIVFFYHPGVRWVSNQVRAERENCCDDIAVSLSGDSVNVARALTNIQDYGMGFPQPAVAAAGKPSGHGLLARVKRLLSPPAAGSDFAAGVIGAFILVVGLFTLVISANTAAALNNGMAADSAVVQDKADKEKELQRQKEEQYARQAAMEREREKKIQEELTKAAALLKAEEAKLDELQGELARLKAKAEKQAGKLAEKEKQQLITYEKEYARHKEKLMKLKQLIITREEKMKRADEFRAQERELQKVKEEMEVRKLEMERQRQQYLLQMEHEKARQEKEIEKLRMLEEKEKQRELELRKVEEELRKKEAEIRAREEDLRIRTERFMKALINELLKDKLIGDPEDFELRFSKGKLYINGKKQSKAVYKKYKKFCEDMNGKPIDEKRDLKIMNKK